MLIKPESTSTFRLFFYIFLTPIIWVINGAHRIIDLAKENEPRGVEDESVLLLGTVSSPGTDGELSEVLDLLIYIDENNNDTYDGEPTDTLIYDGFASALAGEHLSNYAMGANYGSGVDKSVRIEWIVDSGVGNKIQSDSAGFEIEFELLQIEGAD